MVECDYGQYTPDKNGNYHANGHIPPEMIKKRLVVILNAKLHNGCIVVPISSKHDVTKANQGYHVKIEPQHVTQTAFYDARDRWAKADLVQQVSKDRLSTVRGFGGAYITDLLPRDVVAQIQRAVLKAINGLSLISDAVVAERAAVAEAEETAKAELAKVAEASQAEVTTPLTST